MLPLAGLGVAPERGGRVVSPVATVRAAGADVALVLRFVFLAAWIFLAISLPALLIMEERPLRTSTVLAEPKGEPKSEPTPRPVAAE